MKQKAGAALLILLLFAHSSALGETLKLSFIGDCSIGEAIQFRGYDNAYTAVLDEQGMEWPFSLVYPVLSADDMTFANLEVVFTSKTNHLDKVFPLAANPEYAQTLLYSGINVVNTANNHAYDFYRAGYLDTLQTLDDLDLPYFGNFNLGTTEAQDHLLVQTVKGVTIGAVGISLPQDSDMKKIANRIKTLREQGCDLVIVSMHWGREGFLTHESYQTRYAREIIKAGADVIWGHHPHVLQPVQFYNGKPVFYSTGNFTFGTMSTMDPDTGIFQLEYSIDDEAGIMLQSFAVIPCRTQGSGDYRPYVLSDPDEQRAMLQKLIAQKAAAGFENLPASFAETGTLRFSDDIPDEQNPESGRD